MIVDVNVLIYGIDSTTLQHDRCRNWLERAFNGTARVGLPWPTLTAFLRITTHPRIMRSPLTVERAWEYLQLWLDTPVAWIPAPTTQHTSVLRTLTTSLGASGNLVPDAHLAALALEYGVSVVSCDTDFARFTEVHWINPAMPEPLR